MKNVLEIKNHQYNFRRDFLFRSPSLEFSTYKFECSKSFNEFDKNNRKFQRTALVKCMYKTYDLYEV